jgi:hypothetical protein
MTRPRHVVIYPDRFWAIPLRARAWQSLGTGAAARLRASRAIAIAMWATFAACFALIASGAL